LVVISSFQITVAILDEGYIPSPDVHYIVERLETEKKVSYEEAVNTVAELAR
jgi:hypothetical protein